MEILTKIARISYGIMIAGLGLQQIFYASFRPVILPAISFPGLVFCVYLFSALFILAGIAIALDKQAKTISLILGALFLAIFIFIQTPYEIIADPYYKYMGSWTNALKELVFAGGGFVVAGSYPAGRNIDQKQSSFIAFLEKIIPFGSIFMCITMISFGIDHFLYAAGVSALVPSWIPGPMFWTYFAGVALIGSGIAIILRIQLKLTALLLSLMIFLWFIFLHIPRAIADPYSLQGNEVSSVFEALGFSGIAYLIALGFSRRSIYVTHDRN
jgi:uncharacterized membrane protein YphA (DoxX/SURF4 family)